MGEAVNLAPYAYAGAALGIGLAVLGAGLGIGRLAAAAAEAIARQPAAAAQITGATQPAPLPARRRHDSSPKCSVC